ncbi:hypothetical protein EMIT0P74_190054 [Pseudomonas sp. IT-P74]
MPCQRALNSSESAGRVLRKFAVGPRKYSAYDVTRRTPGKPVTFIIANDDNGFGGQNESRTVPHRFRASDRRAGRQP